MKKPPQGSGLRHIAIADPTALRCYFCSRDTRDAGLICQWHKDVLAKVGKDRTVEMLRRMLTTPGFRG